MSFLKGFGRSFREGAEKARNDVRGEMSPAQLDFKQLNDAVEDLAVSDEDIVQKYLNYLNKFPEQRVLEQTTEIMGTIMNRRPGTVSIFERRLQK